MAQRWRVAARLEERRLARRNLHIPRARGRAKLRLRNAEDNAPGPWDRSERRAKPASTNRWPPQRA
eukprot:6677636-Lingulodinium_polyedra.AAC.1